MEKKLKLTGNVIKRYVIFTCPNCHESFKVDLKKILDNLQYNSIELDCPACEQSFTQKIAIKLDSLIDIR